jgi:glutamate synthase domain-containing protein 3
MRERIWLMMNLSDPKALKEEAKVQPSRDINSAIKEKLQSSNRVKISGLKEQDNIAVGLGGNHEINIHGNAGNHLAALNNGAVIILEGSCGDLAGDTMLKGGLIIFGNAGHLLGASMNNGIIVVKGNAGQGLGKSMSGGTIIVDGDVNGDVGEDMGDGNIIITGSVKGTVLKGSSGGSIFVGGEITDLDEKIKSIKTNTKDLSRLSKYFEHYGITAVPRTMRKFQGGLDK